MSMSNTEKTVKEIRRNTRREYGRGGRKLRRNGRCAAT